MKYITAASFSRAGFRKKNIERMDEAILTTRYDSTKQIQNREILQYLLAEIEKNKKAS